MNNYVPHLPEEEINKIVRELSDPNLSPIPYSLDQAGGIVNKVANMVNELMLEYNRKIVEIIANERKEAFQEGLKERKKQPKKKQQI